jgi:hypothetical protein
MSRTIFFFAPSPCRRLPDVILKLVEFCEGTAINTPGGQIHNYYENDFFRCLDQDDGKNGVMVHHAPFAKFETEVAARAAGFDRRFAQHIRFEFAVNLGRYR